MANPRQAIEVLMQQKLAGITTATHPIPRSIRLVTRKGLMWDQVSPSDKPAIVILTEENETENIGTGGVKRTSLTIASIVYERIHAGEEPADVLNAYTLAIGDVLEVNQYWSGLADFTNVAGVVQHKIMASMLPDVEATLAASVQYTWVRE